jgi:hypothetical protein
VATQAGDVTFYVPRRGKHTLLCMDETGRSTRASFVVN